MDIPRPDNFNECYLYEGTYTPLPSPPSPTNNAPRTAHEQG